MGDIRDINATNDGDVATVTHHGQIAAITAGDHGTSGSLALFDAQGRRVVLLMAKHAAPPLLGGDVTRWKAPSENLTLDGERAEVVIGAEHTSGNCYVANDEGGPRVQLQGASGIVRASDERNLPRATLHGYLLTTSPTARHAMKALDRERVFGAVLGKAFRSLDKGRALVPILVTLK